MRQLLAMSYWRSGHSIYKSARMAGVSHSALSEWIMQDNARPIPEGKKEDYKQLALDMLRRGFTDKETAMSLNLSPDILRLWKAGAADIPCGPRLNRNAELKAQAIRMLEGGSKIVEIANAFRVSSLTIRNWTRGHERLSEVKQKMFEMMRKGARDREVVSALGVSKSFASVWRKKEGIPPIPKAPRQTREELCQLRRERYAKTRLQSKSEREAARQVRNTQRLEAKREKAERAERRCQERERIRAERAEMLVEEAKIHELLKKENAKRTEAENDRLRSEILRLRSEGLHEFRICKALEISRARKDRLAKREASTCEKPSVKIAVKCSGAQRSKVDVREATRVPLYGIGRDALLRLQRRQELGTW